ncbi:hypothetical protein PXH66_11905 [Synoicihabitans lomoniglobus]|uniref:Uncharacterized protein n=1 Tax=Synoicihabitans lomoniglobus TaxID=2909285 RepID=A0AAE9ZV47_9BACT|nr:hypothetical protein PXH66_11905 [Opitutaceae bacterium LMO-M01]
MHGPLSALIACIALAGCTTPKRTRFVDVQSTVYGTKIAVIDADEAVVRLRVSGPNEPVFLAMVEPRVIADGLYLFPSYINKPVVSERLEVPVVELDLPAEWRDRIFWVEGESVPRWFQVFRERVRTIERRHLELPDAHESS